MAFEQKSNQRRFDRERAKAEKPVDILERQATRSDRRIYLRQGVAEIVAIRSVTREDRRDK